MGKDVTTNEYAWAVAQETAQGFEGMKATTQSVVRALECTGRVLGKNTDAMHGFIDKQIELAALQRDAAIAAENTARQSVYLAHVSCMAEQDREVSVSPLDLLLGIVNGIEQSGVDLSVCGSREDVALMIETIVKQGANVIRGNMKQGGDDA